MHSATQLALLINIINSSYDAIISKDMDSIITSWNPAAGRIFGYTAEEAVGRHIYLIIPNDFIHEEAQIMQKILHGQSIDHYETQRRRKDGRLISVSISVSPIRDDAGTVVGASKIARDNTELKIARESVAEGELRFKNLLENNNDVIRVFDQDFSTLYCSPNLERVTGWRIDEVTALAVAELIHPEDHQRLLLANEAVKNNPGVSIPFEYRLKHKKGHYIWIEGSEKNLLNDPSIQGIISSYRDITERKKTQESFVRLNKELQSSELQLRLLIEHAPAAIAMFDQQMRYLVVSKRWQKDYQLQNRNIIGLSHYEVFPEISENWKSLHRRALAGEVLHCDEDPFPRSDGTTDWVKWELQPWGKNSGEIGGVILFTEVITKRKEAEQTLALAHRRLLFHIENSPLGYIEFDPDFQVKTLSKRAEEIFGWQEADFKASTITYHKLMHGSDRRRGLAMISDLLSGSVSRSHTQFRFIAKDGKTIWCDCFNSVLRNDDGKIISLMSLVHDISEQKNVEAILRAYNDRYEAVSKATNDAIWDWDIEKDHEVWNHGIESIFGYHTRAIQSTRSWWKEKIHPADFDRVNLEIKNAFAGKARNWDSRYQYLCADGTYKYIHDRAFIIYHDGKPERMIGAMQDVTELVQYQRELETKVELRTEELKKALAVEKELVDMKSNFVTVASHEFRTPLSTIYMATGFIKKFKEKMTGEQIDEKLITIEKQVANMTYLLDDVLFVGKAESGKIELRKELLTPETLRNIAFEAMGSKPAHHRLKFVSACTLTEIETDERLMRNIIINLVTNAVKFSPTSDEVIMNVHCTDRELILAVTDTGIGIPEEDQARLFTSFYRAKNAGAIEGTGLGLTIIKKASELLGGDVKIKSQLGVGTEVIVSLPLKMS
jgi:PAS domain S-box-containing protein